MLILHGENLVASRVDLTRRISHHKTLGDEIIKFVGNQLNLTQITQALESNSIFGQKRLVVIENLLSAARSAEKEKNLNYLKQTSPENLILWEGKKIDGRILAHFKAKAILYDLAPIIFRFLDSLAPGNQRNSIWLLHQCLAKDPPELVFYMLGRQIKSLILAADLGLRGLSGMPEWKKSKIISQAKKFGLDKLLKLYRVLLNIEYQQKTGQTPFSLTSQLDLFLATL